MILSKGGCHLCEVVEAEIRSMGIGAKVDVVDIDNDSALNAEYSMRIPVVKLDGREVFEAKMMDRQGRWKKVLRSLLSGLDTG